MQVNLPISWIFTYFRLGPGVCPKVVAKGLRCIMSNQGAWYLDHLDVPWEEVYAEEPLAGISDAAQQKLVLGGEVCMWGETADTSDALQTIWPRAAAAAGMDFTSSEAFVVSSLFLSVISGCRSLFMAVKSLQSVCGVPWRPYPRKTWKRPSCLGYTTSDACWITVESPQLQSQTSMLGDLQSALAHVLSSKQVVKV
jgi:hypothetical protein